MAAKVTLFYNQFTRGFTETWFTSGFTASTDFDSPPWVSFLSSAVKFRGSGTALWGARISDQAPSPKASKLELFENKYLAPTTTTSVDRNPDIVSTDAVYFVANGNVPQAKKLMFFRGLRDDQVARDADGNMVPSPNLTTLVDSYMRNASALDLRIRYKSTANVVYQVLQMNPNAGNIHYTDLTINAAFAGAGAAPFFVYGLGIDIDDAPGFPKIAKVISSTVVAPLTVTIPYRLRASSLPVTPPNQRLTQVTYIYESFSTWEFRFFSEHKTGRPFGSLRGRSRSLVRAQ